MLRREMRFINERKVLDLVDVDVDVNQSARTDPPQNHWA
jgi:hypothetical protein